MKWGRELLLLFAVGGAGTAWYFSVERDRKQIEIQEEALFPGFDAARVRCILAENTRYDWRMRLERDERGAWKMIDPTAVPANYGRIDHLLQVALAARGREVPASERDPVQLGFSPPRLVLELEEQVDGKSHHERVEIGGLDADGRSVNVRVRERYLRVVRALDTALDRQLDEFKTPLALEFQISDVVRIHRTGSLQREGASAPADVALELERGEEGWRSLAPEGLQLDPVFVGTWLQGLASIQHAGYYDELSGPIDKAGLEPAELRLELELRDGSKQALRIGRPGHAEGQVWYGLREGLGVVWGLEQPSVWLVGYPLEEMVDPRILRARREDVTTITLHRAQDELYFTPQGKLWHVAKKRAGEKAFDKALLADPAKVEALLAVLEKIELTGVKLGETVPETPERSAVWVGVGGTTFGGWIDSATATDAQGHEAVRFQRRGENACALAPLALRTELERPMEDFWSMKLGDIAEHEQSFLAIQGLGKDLRYTRQPNGQWSFGEEKGEAKELHTVLDALCFLRAARYLAPRVDPPWDDPVTVKFTSPYGKELVIGVGRSREGKPGEEVEVSFDKLRAVAKDQGLHARLLEILGKH